MNKISATIVFESNDRNFLPFTNLANSEDYEGPNKPNEMTVGTNVTNLDIHGPRSN
jgi:hypothetical protein